MKKLILMVAAALMTGFGFAAAIENVIALQRPGTGIVDIYYDLIINEGGTTVVSAAVDGGGGAVRMQTLSGDIGHVVPGPARHIMWNAQADNPEKMFSGLRVAISASVMDVIENSGMKEISGTYRCLVDGSDWSWNGDKFYIDRAPVSGALWNKVASWAVQHGYKFRNSYSASARVVYPHSEDAWVWCNARSAMEGLPLCHNRREGTYYYDYSCDATDYHLIYPQANGGYRLPFLWEMTAAFCAGVIKDSSTSAGFAAWMSTGMPNIGYVQALIDSNPAEYQYCSAYNGLKKPLYCVRDVNSSYSIEETFPPNYSSPFAIDTRMNSPTFPKDFKIIDVKSKYCDGKYGKGRKALFLRGVSCVVEFEAEVYGGELAYLERVDNEDAPAVGEQISLEDGKFSLNVGSMALGNPFIVRAHSVDGRCSQPFRLNFDVASQKGTTWTASPGKDSIQYRTVELDSFQLFDKLGADQPDVLGAEKSKFISSLVDRFHDYPRALQVGVNVCWTLDSSEGIIRGLALFGAQASSADNAASFTKKLAEMKARGWKQALKFGKVSGYIKAGVENTWSWDTRALNWVEHGDYIAFNVGANGCFFRNWIPTPIPWYYSADGGIDVFLRAQIANGGLQYSIDSDKLLYLTLRIGIGLPSVLSIEGSGTGSMFMTYDTEADPSLQRLGMALTLALKAQMVGFVLPIWDWTGECNWVGGDNEFTDIDIGEIVDKAMDRAVNDVGVTDILPRDYLDDNAGIGGTGNSHGWPGIPSVVDNVYPTSCTPVEICDNGMPSPTPQASGDTPAVATDGDSGGTPPDIVRTPKIAVSTDNPSRSPRTRATIVTISDLANTTFTAEDAVWDDGTPDYHPVTARMTNGCSVVAWMNEREGMPKDISLGEMLSAMEIAVAVWNDETGEWSHLNLTDNSAYDRSPVLKTATNGTAAVAWLRNAYTNYIGSVSKPNQVCFARYAGGVWTAESVVVPSVGRVRKLDMAYDGNRAAIVFNEEDDPGNGTTQRLCVVIGDCSTWEPCRTVAESSANGSAAYAYFDESGDLRLVWNDEGAVNTGLYANGTLTAGLIDTDEHQVPSDYVFTRAHSGRMALVWLERMNEGDPAMGPVAMTCNPACGVWTLPCALTWDGKNKTEVSAAFNDAGDLEVFYATPNVATDEQGIAETVSSGFSKVTRRHGGDAAIFLKDVPPSTNEFAVGETVDVTFQVKNLGDESVSNVSVVAVDWSNGYYHLTNIACVAGLADGQTIISSSSPVRINELQVGQCLEMKAPWTVRESTSSELCLEFTVRASGESIMPQNDRATWRFGSADVSILRAQSRMDEQSPNVRHVSVVLENAGMAAAPAGTVVTFRRGTAEGAVLATKTVGRILAGGEGVQQAGFAWDISSIAPTSNVEVVHVMAVLPESADAAERTLETAVVVDVAPVVKSPVTAYTLAYDANGGEGTMASERPFYDEWGALASNTFTRAGHSFAGWALSSTGEVSYADGAAYWNVPMFTRDTATLYAVWVRCAEETSTTEVPVPFDWLGAYFPEATNATADIDGRIANFEAIANRQTGKRDGSGRALTVADDYVMGTDPTNSTDVFTAAIKIVAGEPRIVWSPNLNTNGIVRSYIVLGKTNLTDKADWAPTNSAHHFFKVSVEMP